ncbi:hypothetical protein Acr_18g0006930 [Actinidia rufa]|uniref:Bifunctional inhibitor/plant lipid transfer protein/seed storage helical domain-containing protein n=1 Tax=Actinidia rufa TaxID=165716 RepID=A0A7J0G6W4_9ERIC|nr:hypothetical protein Acr_18g0006930 [Actinidia rufa]
MKNKCKFKPTWGLYDWHSAKQASVELLNKIRRTFNDDDRTYKAFLDITATIVENPSEIDGVYKEVSRLFKDEPGLSIEFSKFASDGYQTVPRGTEEDGLKGIRRNCLLTTTRRTETSSKIRSASFDKYLTILDFRCIKKLYGDSGDDMVEVFRRDPIRVGKEIILPRVEQKIKEAVELRSEKAEIWRKPSWPLVQSQPTEPPSPPPWWRRRNPRQQQQCREQIQRQQNLRHCQMYLAQGRDQYEVAMVTDINPQQQQHLRECCQQLRSMDEECRCDGVRTAVRQQQGQREREEMGQVMQKAQDLPSKCNLSPADAKSNLAGSK